MFNVLIKHEGEELPACTRACLTQLDDVGRGRVPAALRARRHRQVVDVSWGEGEAGPHHAAGHLTGSADRNGAVSAGAALECIDTNEECARDGEVTEQEKRDSEDCFCKRSKKMKKDFMTKQRKVDTQHQL